MKKLIALFLTVLLALSAFSVMSFAEDAVPYVVCDFSQASDGSKTNFSYATSLLGTAKATAIGATSVYIKAFVAQPGSLGNDWNDNAMLNIEGAGTVYTNGSRRTKVFDLSGNANAGKYTVSIWLCDPGSAMTNEKSDFSVLLTFHGDDTSDASLHLDWNNKETTLGAIRVLNTHKKNASGEEVEEIKGNNWEKYTGTKGEMAATGNVQNVAGKTWVEYSGEVELTGTASKVALWLYQWDGYDNQTQIQFYLDDLKVAGENAEGTVEEITTDAETTTEAETTTAEETTTEATTTEATTTEAATDNDDGDDESNKTALLIGAAAGVVILAAAAVIITTLVRKKKNSAK